MTLSVFSIVSEYSILGYKISGQWCFIDNYLLIILQSKLIANYTVWKDLQVKANYFLC